MPDRDGVMKRQGLNTKVPDMSRLMENAQVMARERAVPACRAEAEGYARAGMRAVREAGAVGLRKELVDALDGDPEMSEAFAALTPGRRRSYVIALASAKASATRVARIAKYRGKILQGMGAHEY